jgi:hypothetical protein
MCGMGYPNERFGGKGLKRVYCGKCRRKTNFKQDLLMRELWGLLFDQSNISKKNCQRLKSLVEESDFPDVCQRARLVLRIAQVHPQAKNRIKVLRAKFPELIQPLREVGWFCDEPEHDCDALPLEPLAQNPDDEDQLDFHFY